MTYVYNAKLKDPPSLQDIHVLSVHSVTADILCPMGLVYCNVMLGSLYILSLCVGTYTTYVVTGEKVDK